MHRQTLEKIIAEDTHGLLSDVAIKFRNAGKTKYSLQWWFIYGQQTKRAGYVAPNNKSHAKSKICDIAFKIGYWVA